jgi:hypothetical protein
VVIIFHVIPEISDQEVQRVGQLLLLTEIGLDLRSGVARYLANRSSHLSNPITTTASAINELP